MHHKPKPRAQNGNGTKATTTMMTSDARETGNMMRVEKIYVTQMDITRVLVESVQNVKHVKHSDVNEMHTLRSATIIYTVYCVDCVHGTPYCLIVCFYV